MKIFVKYKQQGYDRKYRFLDTDYMFIISFYESRVWMNEYRMRQIADLQTFGWLFEKNMPVFVVDNIDGIEKGKSVSYGVIEPRLVCMINTSEIAMVFPMEKEKETKSDFWLCSDCGAQLPDCTCPSPTRYKDHVCAPEDPFVFPGKCKICGAIKDGSIAD